MPTIPELLQGKRISLPRWAEHRTFKKAPRAGAQSTSQTYLLDHEGELEA